MEILLFIIRHAKPDDIFRVICDSPGFDVSGASRVSFFDDDLVAVYTDNKARMRRASR